MKKIIPTLITAAYLGASALVGGCGPGYDAYSHAEDLSDFEGVDVDIYKKGKSLHMIVGERGDDGKIGRPFIETKDIEGNHRVDVMDASTVPRWNNLEKLTSIKKLSELQKYVAENYGFTDM